MRNPDTGVQQSQIVVDFGDRRDGAAGTGRSRFLVDRQRRRETVDRVDIGPRDLIQKLPGVGRQAVDVLSLAFGKQRVEGQRAFAAARRLR